MQAPAPLAPSLEEACHRWSSRPAITFHGATITYAELWSRVQRLARSLLELGVKPGDRVVCQLPNCPEHVIAIAATWAAGAIHVGTDNDLTGAELARLVGQVGAAAVIFQPRQGSSDRLASLAAVAQSAPGTILVLHEPPQSQELDGIQPSELDGVGLHRFSNLVDPDALDPAASKECLPSQPGPDEVSVLLLTSGTTGKSKAVMESRSACWAKMQFFADAYIPGPDDVHLLYLPIAHVFGFRLGLIALLSGGRLVLLDRFTPDGALALVSEEAVTILPGMPTHLSLLLGAPDSAIRRCTSLRWCLSAASQLPVRIAQGVYDQLGAQLLYVFGCAEGFTIRTTDPADILAGSVGSTVFQGPPGTAQDGTVAVMGPGREGLLPAGEVGEIVFGARCPVRYWDDPDTATDGWYHTGDLGKMDELGRVFVVGRLKELVNRGGLKVSPSEIETAIMRHGAISDAGVIASPDPVLGEAICACIVSSRDGPSATPDLAGLRAFLGNMLARHKLPDELCAVPEIPRTKIGKVNRPALRALVVDRDLPRERLRPR
jgi:acyl-CoA synthetase (AMP-forming)/AMP-acid ligase II